MRTVLPPYANTRKPSLLAPPRACDSHLHVYGPAALYPLVAERNYTPDPNSTLDNYLKVHRTLGLERAVIVTGSANVLAIQALNATATDSRFLICPDLCYEQTKLLTIFCILKKLIFNTAKDNLTMKSNPRL